jgi:hypothetical protein
VVAALLVDPQPRIGKIYRLAGPQARTSIQALPLSDALTEERIRE